VQYSGRFWYLFARKCLVARGRRSKSVKIGLLFVLDSEYFEAVKFRGAIQKIDGEEGIACFALCSILGYQKGRIHRNEQNVKKNAIALVSQCEIEMGEIH
jgi:hypothetical protein